MSTLRWTIILAGGAIAAGVVLWTGLTAPSFTTAQRADVSESPPVASAGPASTETVPENLKFVPSAVIDPNPTFFFGTGDGSNGYHAERPRQEPHPY
jgi:hypothetical protein